MAFGTPVVDHWLEREYVVCNLWRKQNCFVSVWCAIYKESRIVLSVCGVQFMKQAGELFYSEQSQSLEELHKLQFSAESDKSYLVHTWQSAHVTK